MLITFEVKNKGKTVHRFAHESSFVPRIGDKVVRCNSIVDGPPYTKTRYHVCDVTYECEVDEITVSLEEE